MSQNQNPKNTENLNNEELKNTTGGSLLGGDDSMIKGVTQGYVNVSNTDEDGETRSTNLDFGSGSMFQKEND